MVTALCLKNKMEFLDKQINASKTIQNNCSNYDTSYNLLKKENELLMKHIESQKQDNEKMITEDKRVSFPYNPYLYTTIYCYWTIL
jgi:hypothetical protein